MLPNDNYKEVALEDFFSSGGLTIPNHLERTREMGH